MGKTRGFLQIAQLFPLNSNQAQLAEQIQLRSQAEATHLDEERADSHGDTLSDSWQFSWGI
jgi:outer membrane murein-binding lipoprotein Lpp